MGKRKQCIENKQKMCFIFVSPWLVIGFTFEIIPFGCCWFWSFKPKTSSSGVPLQNGPHNSANKFPPPPSSVIAALVLCDCPIPFITDPALGKSFGLWI